MRELLARGANPAAGDDTPLSWAVHGSRYHELPGRDHVAVAELLVAAGNAIEPRFLDAADGSLLEWLEFRLPGEL